jgi:hypothetical protein
MSISPSDKQARATIEDDDDAAIAIALTAKATIT